MSKIRVILSIIILCSGVALAVFHVLHQNYASAALFFVLSVILASTILLGFLTTYEIPFFKEITVPIVLILGLYSVFSESPGFDLERQKAHIDALNAFAKIDLRQCPTNNELYSLQKEGMKACVLQNNTDQMRAVSDLQKARLLGPTSSFLDGIRSAVIDDNKDWCAEIFKITYKLCPKAFLLMPEDSKTILKKES